MWSHTVTICKEGPKVCHTITYSLRIPEGEPGEEALGNPTNYNEVQMMHNDVDSI